MFPIDLARLSARHRALLALVASSARRAPRSRAPSRRVPALTALVDGREIALPVLKVDVEARIQGDLATVTMTQLFANSYPVPIHARYVFPLPDRRRRLRDAARERRPHDRGRDPAQAEARAVYESAKQRGNQAALLEQHRPNVFTQEVANLVPGAPIRVELEYAHAVEKSGGDYRFHVPTVVGPRYLPPAHQGDDAGAPTRASRARGARSSRGGGLEPARERAGRAARERRSRARRAARRARRGHADPLAREPDAPHRGRAPRRGARGGRPAEGRTLDDRDFELHYRLAGEAIAAGVTAFAAGRRRLPLRCSSSRPRASPTRRRATRDGVRARLLGQHGRHAARRLEAVHAPQPRRAAARRFVPDHPLQRLGQRMECRAARRDARRDRRGPRLRRHARGRGRHRDGERHPRRARAAGRRGHAAAGRVPDRRLHRQRRRDRAPARAAARRRAPVLLRRRRQREPLPDPGDGARRARRGAHRAPR